MHTSDIDPDLERQLNAAEEDEPVEAVLLLRPGADSQPADADALIERVCDRSTDTIEVSYLPRIRALVVRAHSRVIRQLISQPEVEMASANQLEGDEEL